MVGLGGGGGSVAFPWLYLLLLIIGDILLHYDNVMANGHQNIISIGCAGQKQTSRICKIHLLIKGQLENMIFGMIMRVKTKFPF